MDAVSYSLASKQAQRIEKFIENPDSTSGIVTVPKTIASGETVTVSAGRVAVLPNVVVDGTLNIDGEVFIPSGSSVDFSNGIKIDGNNIALSIPTSYHLLGGNLTTTITANYIETSATTTRNYTTSDYIFDSTNNKLYDCILASTSGILLTNTTYFTSVTAGTLSINNALIPLAHGIDSNGSKNSIVVANETITGVTYTEGKNYLYKTDTGYGVKAYEPRYLKSELVRRFAGEQPDYYDVDSNKWFNTDAGSELVSNGTFSSGVTTGWTAYSSVISIVNNTLQIIPNASVEGGAYTTITTVVGKRYTLIGSIIQDASSYAKIRVGTIAGGDNIAITAAGVNKHTLSFIAQSTTTYVAVHVGGGNQQNTKVDNISVFAYDIVPTTEITESRNYLNHIVHADQNGQVTYVEELPKIEYKDIVKAEEYLGKNACTAWVNFDGTTTPPTIRDSYNVSAVIRTATGTGAFDIYFKEPMDNTNYGVFGTSNNSGSAFGSYVVSGAPISSANDGKFMNKVTIGILNTNGYYNPISASIQIFGGRN